MGDRSTEPVVPWTIHIVEFSLVPDPDVEVLADVMVLLVVVLRSSKPTI